MGEGQVVNQGLGDGIGQAQTQHDFYLRTARSAHECGRAGVPATYPPYLPIMPNSALIRTAAMPTGMAIFQPMFINWS